MAEKVRDVMTETPETVSPSDTVQDAARKMESSDAGALLVVEGDELKGIVTDRDIVLGAVAEGRCDAKVEEVCSTEPAVVAPDDGVDRAIELMREKKVRRLPVVEDGNPIGVVSLGDLALDRDDDSVLAEISAAAPNN